MGNVKEKLRGAHEIHDRNGKASSDWRSDVSFVRDRPLIQPDFQAKTKAAPTTLNAVATTAPIHACWLPKATAPLLLFEPEVPDAVFCALLPLEAVVDGAEGTKVAMAPDRQELTAAETEAALAGAPLTTVALPPKSQDCALRLVNS